MFSLITSETPAPLKDISCTLPGRWQRSLNDAKMAIDLGIGVRIVKGQWPDLSNPDADTSEGFLAVVRAMAGSSNVVRIATHDPGLVRQSIEILQAANTRCEIELLYGLPTEKIIPIAIAKRILVRLYIPYGHAWIPYSLDRIRKQPKMVAWLVKDVFFGTGLKSMPDFNETEPS